jgi:hypothetical protein
MGEGADAVKTNQLGLNDGCEGVAGMIAGAV